jgi:hypothetical protein
VYPNLSLAAEKWFVRDYVAMHIAMPAPPNGANADAWEHTLVKSDFVDMVVKVIVKAQEIVRSYHDHIPRVYMSIRNLIRAVHMLSWLLQFDVATENDPRDGSPKSLVNIFLPPAPEHLYGASAFDNSLADTQHRMRTALVMAVTTVYMLQLPSSGHVAAKRAKVDLRLLFLREITQTWRECLWDGKVNSRVMTVESWNGIIVSSWRHLWSYATIPRGNCECIDYYRSLLNMMLCYVMLSSGIAATNTLMENFYSIILASMNGMPVLITGPPGCGE